MIDVNARQRRVVLDKARAALGTFEGKTVTLLGLSFKPNTDDLREAPAVHIARALLDEGAAVNGYDPAAMKAAAMILPEVNYFDDPYTACEQSDLVMILTEWNEFRDLDLERVKRAVRSPILYDTRNVYELDQVRSAGFQYLCTGRPTE